MTWKGVLKRGQNVPEEYKSPLGREFAALNFIPPYGAALYDAMVSNILMGRDILYEAL